MKHSKKAPKKPTESLYKTQPTQEISQPKSAINFIEKPPTNPETLLLQIAKTKQRKRREIE